MLISRFNIEESDCFFTRKRGQGVKPRGVKNEKNFRGILNSIGIFFDIEIKIPRGVYPRLLTPREFKSSFFCPRGVQISEIYTSRYKNLEIPKTRILYLDMSILEDNTSRKQNLDTVRTIKKGFTILNCVKKMKFLCFFFIVLWFLTKLHGKLQQIFFFSISIFLQIFYYLRRMANIPCGRSR